MQNLFDLVRYLHILHFTLVHHQPIDHVFEKKIRFSQVRS